jgi:NAD(P)-dependent dehydrogenase (short-subunit alcohol dehydrogenase family)
MKSAIVIGAASGIGRALRRQHHTPTLVIVDREGVRVYYPSRMTQAELERLVRRLVDAGATGKQ